MKNILIVLLTVLFSACAKKEEVKQEVEAPEAANNENFVELNKAQYQTAGIELGKTTIRNLSDIVTANGVIDIPPQNLVSISAPMGGFVKKTDLLQGMYVKKGQVLATLENPDFIQMQQDYLETESKLEYASLDLKRQLELGRENINAQKTLQLADSEVKIQKARLAGLRERILTAGINLRILEAGTIVNSAVILSPISGSVTTVNVNLGKYVTPTDVMFEIVDTHHLHVELSIFEKDISKIKIGQSVRFTLVNNPGKELLAEVYLINQKINEDRTVRVHCHLIKDDENLLPRNFVKAVVETGANPVAVLPDEAIVDFEGKSYIFTGQNASSSEKMRDAVFRFEIQEVKKGVSENGFTEVIFAGESPNNNESIVLKGAYALLSKLKNAEEED